MPQNLPQKVPQARAHKISEVLPGHIDRNNLDVWIDLYIKIVVLGSSRNTIAAKQSDLLKFSQFFHEQIGAEHIDLWTPSISRAFQSHLFSTYQATTINRIMATLRHFASWLNDKRPLPAGHPLDQVVDIQTDDPVWMGLSRQELAALRSAVDIRLKTCTKKQHNAPLEAAVFYTLLHTGLRGSELCALSQSQYHSRGFHQVKRKGKKVSRKVPVPGEARKYLDAYLEGEQKTGKLLVPDQPLFISKRGGRLTMRALQKILTRINNQANAHMPDDRKFKVTPHMLRHTFLNGQFLPFEP